MDSSVWLALLAGVLLGAVLGAAAVILLRRQFDGGAGTLRAHYEQQREENAQHLQAAEDWRRQLQQTQQQLAASQGQLAEVERRREDESNAARERETLVEMLHPVRQGVTEMQRRIQLLETERAEQHSALSQQLTAAAATDAKLIESTQALLGSLHATSARGHWGEIQLRRVVESAGMLAHVDFTEQHSARSSSGETLRPDMVVHLPGGRQLVVDAKAPLSPDDPAAQARALRQRVDELVKKRYWDAVELSPDVVFCFIPAESLLAAALEADGRLLDDAIAKGVTLVSPSSLLAALKAVETAWRHESLAQNVNEMVELSRKLYQRLARTSDYLKSVGDRLRQAVDAYNKLIGNIGRQVMPTLDAMSKIQVRESAGEAAAHSPGAAVNTLQETLGAATVDAEIKPLSGRFSVSSAEGSAEETEKDSR